MVVAICALTGEPPQAHAAGGEVLHGVDQMDEVAAETVEFQTTSTSPFLRTRKQLSSSGRSSRTPEAKSAAQPASSVGGPISSPVAFSQIYQFDTDLGHNSQ